MDMGTKGAGGVALAVEPEAQPLPSGAKRVSVVFAPQTYAKILYIAEHKGTNKTEALRQSVFLTEHLVKAAEEGAKVFIDRNGKLSELVL